MRKIAMRLENEDNIRGAIKVHSRLGSTSKSDRKVPLIDPSMAMLSPLGEVIKTEANDLQVEFCPPPQIK